MTTLESIESRVRELSIYELAEFRRWFMDFDSDAWDAQIEEDAKSGKLDALVNEAIGEYNAGNRENFEVTVRDPLRIPARCGHNPLISRFRGRDPAGV